MVTKKRVLGTVALLSVLLLAGLFGLTKGKQPNLAHAYSPSLTCTVSGNVAYINSYFVGPGTSTVHLYVNGVEATGLGSPRTVSTGVSTPYSVFPQLNYPLPNNVVVTLTVAGGNPTSSTINLNGVYPHGGCGAQTGYNPPPHYPPSQGYDNLARVDTSVCGRVTVYFNFPGGNGYSLYSVKLNGHEIAGPVQVSGPQRNVIPPRTFHLPAADQMMITVSGAAGPFNFPQFINLATYQHYYCNPTYPILPYPYPYPLYPQYPLPLLPTATPVPPTPTPVPPTPVPPTPIIIVQPPIVQPPIIIVITPPPPAPTKTPRPPAPGPPNTGAVQVKEESGISSALIPAAFGLLLLLSGGTALVTRRVRSRRP